jgi:hypothetical protein
MHAPDCEHGVALQLQRPAGSPLLHLPPAPPAPPPPPFHCCGRWNSCTGTSVQWA